MANLLSGNKNLKLLIVTLIITALAVGAYYILVERGQKRVTLEEALIELESGDKEKAVSDLEKLHKENPGDETVAIHLAQSYLQSSNYSKVIDLSKESEYKSSIMLNVTASAYRAIGDSENAQIYYQKALDSSPTNANGYIVLAAYYQGQGKLSEALSICETGIEKIPSSGKILVTAASIALKLNDTSKAKAYVKKALELEPNNQQAKTIAGEIK